LPLQGMMIAHEGSYVGLYRGRITRSYHTR
jgi:hypothetical protein